MVWFNNRVSYSAIVWLRSCPMAFDLSMSGVRGKLRDTFQKGADFGVLSEAVWDRILLDRWLEKPEAEVESLLIKELKDMDTESAEKFEGGFLDTFVRLRKVLDFDYKVSLQEKLKVPIRGMEQYGKLDYLITSNDPDNPRTLIIDAKATRGKKKEIPAQLLHYAYLYRHIHGVLPETYAMYTRMGRIDKYNYTDKTLDDYGAVLEREMSAIIPARKKELAHFYQLAQKLPLLSSIDMPGLVALLDARKQGTLPDKIGKMFKLSPDSAESKSLVKALKADIPEIYPGVVSSKCYMCPQANTCQLNLDAVDRKRNPMKYVEQIPLEHKVEGVFELDF